MNFKSKKGSISVFVFVAILFIAGILVLMFANAKNKSETVDRQFAMLNTIYTPKNSDINVVYQEMNKQDEKILNATWLSGTEKTQLSKTKLTVEDKESGNNFIKGYLLEKVEAYIIKAPIPDGFYYVGGTIQTGLIISDDANDAGKGTNQDSNLTGKQFVWIPTRDLLNNTNDTDQINDVKIKGSANYYQGFFIGRYITRLDIVGNVIIKEANSNVSNITRDKIPSDLFNINKVTQFVCSSDITNSQVIWKIVVGFMAKNTEKLNDWTINPTKNIYTTTENNNAEEFENRIALFVNY